MHFPHHLAMMARIHFNKQTVDCIFATFVDISELFGICFFWFMMRCRSHHALSCDLSSFHEMLIVLMKALLTCWSCLQCLCFGCRRIIGVADFLVDHYSLIFQGLPDVQ
jgi:hypothetical protein